MKKEKKAGPTKIHNPNSELLESTKNTPPIELIKTHFPSINITETKRKNTQFFQDILCDIYFICHLLKNLSEEYKKNKLIFYLYNNY